MDQAKQQNIELTIEINQTGDTQAELDVFNQSLTQTFCINACIEALEDGKLIADLNSTTGDGNTISDWSYENR